MKLIELENLNRDSKKTKEIRSILLQAFNDWPADYDTVEQYVDDIEEFIGNIANRQIIEKQLLCIDISKYAWQAESLVVILDVFDYFDEELTLKQIIQKLI